MALGFDLPVFANGIASAQELNKLTLAQEYVQNFATFSAGIEYIERDLVYGMVHKHRYLHWYLAAPANVDLYLNGGKYYEVRGGATFGYFDLQTHTGLQTNDVYAIEWRGADVNGIYFIEHPTTSFGWSYPYGIPSFSNGAVLTAAALNQVSQNTKYILDYLHDKQQRGFTQVLDQHLTEFGGPGLLRKEWFFRLRHEHRYLYVATQRRMYGTDGDRKIKLLLNGSAYYQANERYQSFWPHAVALDMEGTDHWVYEGEGNTVTRPYTIERGDWYEVTVFFETTPDSANSTDDECSIYVVGEMAQRYYI